MKNKLMIAALGFIISGYVLTVNIALAEEANHWIKKSQKIKGSWNVETRDDGDYLVLDEDFNTRKGPDLKLILTKLPSSEVTSDNATSDSVTIAPLSSSKGEQSYKLPEQYQDYSTLLIHCEKYSKLWGASDFNHSDDSDGE